MPVKEQLYRVCVTSRIAIWCKKHFIWCYFSLSTYLTMFTRPLRDIGKHNTVKAAKYLRVLLVFPTHVFFYILTLSLSSLLLHVSLHFLTSWNITEQSLSQRYTKFKIINLKYITECMNSAKYLLDGNIFKMELYIIILCNFVVYWYNSTIQTESLNWQFSTSGWSVTITLLTICAVWNFRLLRIH
jgi:hypothetical protein